MDEKQHVLVIGRVWPEPGSSAAGIRMMQLLSLFRDNGWRVTFSSSAQETNNTADLAPLGINKSPIELNSSSFDIFIRELNPDMVFFDRFMTEEQFGWRVAEHCPDALRILDTEDLHSLRIARQKAFRSNRNFSADDLFSEETAKREIASIFRSDLSLIISEFEMNLLKNTFHIDPSLLHYLPFLLGKEDIDTSRESLSYESRIHFVTIGNFLHEPNRNAVHFLKEEIWPGIREKIPDAELHVYGAYADQKTNVLHKPEEGFHIMGRAEDAGKVVGRARVCLAPLRFGAGLKGKLIEAMHCGTPSVTTSIGAEAIPGDNPWSGVIADKVSDFISASVELYENRTLWQEARRHGYDILKKRLSKDLFEEDFLNTLLNLKQNLDEHRRKNFIGAILLHHSAASTKYMSRWIEAKNR